MSIYDWFSGLATIGGFAYFLLGFIVSYIINWVNCRYKHQEMRIPWHYAGIGIGVAAIVIVTIQSSIAYNTARLTADQVQSCQKEFNTIIRERSRIQEENDKWSIVQRKAFGDWLRIILSPPADIADLRKNDPTNPRINEWGYSITAYFSDIIQQAQTEQDKNFEERKNHPLPDPTCGK